MNVKLFEMENEIPIEELKAGNELIGRWMGVNPEIEYCVGGENEIRYCPKNNSSGYYSTPERQKRECESFLEDNAVYREQGLEVLKREWWPFYHNDWNQLIPAIEKADKYISRQFSKDAQFALDHMLEAFSEYNRKDSWKGLVAFINEVINP